MSLSHNPNSPVISDVGESVRLKKLILSAKNGDVEAFGAIYEELYTPLYRYVLSRSHNIELTKDISQQTFLRFYEALDAYEPEKTPLAYLFTIAKRLLINHQEKLSSIPFDETLMETLGDQSIDIMSDSHIKRLSESIDEYLPSLNDDERDVIRLHFYGELSHKEISHILEKEEAYIRKIKERALKKLRALTHHLHEGN